MLNKLKAVVPFLPILLIGLIGVLILSRIDNDLSPMPGQEGYQEWLEEENES